MFKGRFINKPVSERCYINHCVSDGLLNQSTCLALVHQNLHLKTAAQRTDVTHLAPAISPGWPLGAGPGPGRERVALAPSVRGQARHQHFEPFQTYHRDLWTVSRPHEVPFASTKHTQGDQMVFFPPDFRFKSAAVLSIVTCWFSVRSSLCSISLPLYTPFRLSKKGDLIGERCF